MIALLTFQKSNCFFEQRHELQWREKMCNKRTGIKRYTRNFENNNQK